VLFLVVAAKVVAVSAICEFAEHLLWSHIVVVYTGMVARILFPNLFVMKTCKAKANVLVPLKPSAVNSIVNQVIS
jgi:hypothetical protein